MSESLEDDDLIAFLDEQFTTCLTRDLPDTEELIDILSAVHAALERLLGMAADVSIVLKHILFCRQFEEIADLAITLLEPFFHDPRYERLLEDPVDKDSMSVDSIELPEGAQRRSSVTHTQEEDGDGASYTSSLTDGSLRRHGGSISPSLDNGVPSPPNESSPMLGLEPIPERPLTAHAMVYVPSWDGDADPLWGTRKSPSQVLEAEVPVKSVARRRPPKLNTDVESRAHSADLVMLQSSGTSLHSIERLSATTGSFPAQYTTDLSFESDYSRSLPAPDNSKVGSVTPKAVGKYLSDGRRVHSIVSSRRSVLSGRARYTDDTEDTASNDGSAASSRTYHGPKTSSVPFKKSPAASETSGDDATTTPEREKHDAFVYLTPEEIHPVPAPGREIERVVAALPVQDWPDVFYTLNTVRSLAAHHSERLVASSNLHAVVVAVTKLMDNLRSALAKNAMLALGDLFQSVGAAAMDVELPRCVDMLLKRAIDRNGFVSEVAEEVLGVVLANSSFARCMSALVAGTSHRSPAARGKAMQFIARLLSTKGAELRGFRDTDAFLARVAKMLTDHTPEARYYARQIVRLLLSKGLIARQYLEAHISPDEIDKANDKSLDVPWQSSTLSETAKTKGALAKSLKLSTIDEASAIYKSPVPVVSPPLHGGAESSESSRVEKPKGRAKVSNGKRSSEPHFNSAEAKQLLSDLFKEVHGSVWTARNVALTRISEAIFSFHDSGSSDATKFILSCLDLVLEKLDDGNVKVSLHALTCLQGILDRPEIALLSPPNNIIQPLLGSASASNKQVASLASAILKKYVTVLPINQVAQHLSTIAMHDKDRLRVSAMRLIAENIALYSQDLITTKKVIFPAICACLFAASSKGDIKVAAGDALKALQRAIDVRVWQWVDDMFQQDEIRRLTL